jgi:hypothetical protein
MARVPVAPVVRLPADGGAIVNVASVFARLGELVAEMPKAKGARTAGGGNGAGGSVVRPPADTPTLAAQGISKSESSRWHDLGRLPRRR